MILTIVNTDNFKEITWLTTEDSGNFMLTSIIVALRAKPECYCLGNNIFVGLNRGQIAKVIDDVKQYEPESTSFLREIRKLLY
jgi:hypothetical protein